MSSFIYSEGALDLDCFSKFVSDKSSLMQPIDQTSTGGLIPNIQPIMLEEFIEYAYPKEADLEFKKINKNLINYYLYLFDGLVLAAKNGSCLLQESKN